MKQLLAFAVLMLTGCAGFTTWVTAHKAELAAAGLVAGTVQVTTGAVSSTIKAARDVSDAVTDKKE